MKTYTCPIILKCPIFRENVFHNKKTGLTYRAMFCEAGFEKYKNCKRYQAVKKSGMMVPENILPNSKLTVDEIIRIMTSSLN